MSVLTAVATPQVMSIGMGQTGIGQRSTRLTAVLGSCLGVAIYHRRLFLGAMVHIVLPESSGREAAPGKFADTAIPHMVELLKSHGALPSGLVAKFAGGACMFGATGPMQIGLANAEAVKRQLKEFRIPVIAEDVGGTKGRRVIFDCEQGTLTVEIAGAKSKVL
ncbi:MAG: chemotaxis protein CheD [Patescibacteria group bacterium]|nr:chemotaxis protein CheD [Patescibacteria group bacterium]